MTATIGLVFSEPVALQNHEPDLGPELLGVRVQRCASDDKCPEFPAESTVNPPIAPPTPEDTDAGGAGWAPFGHVAPDVSSEAFQDSRHTNQHRHALSMDRFLYDARMQAAHEHHRSIQYQGDENAHRLAEHVTQREHHQKPDGLEESGPFLVPLDLVPDRVQVGTDVSVAVDHSLRLGGRSGCIDDFDDIVRIHRRGRKPGVSG